jgi:hypothetical protein
VDFSIRTVIETRRGRDPVAVKEDVSKALSRRLALVARADGTVPRTPGVPVTHRDVAAWIRGVDDVLRIVSLELRDRAGRPLKTITVTADGLPRWTSTNSSIDVQRPASGGAR